MRCLSLYALPLTLAGLTVAAAMVFAWSNDPRPAAIRDDNLSRDGGSPAPAVAKASVAKAPPAQFPKRTHHAPRDAPHHAERDEYVKYDSY